MNKFRNSESDVQFIVSVVSGLLLFGLLFLFTAVMIFGNLLVGFSLFLEMLLSFVISLLGVWIYIEWLYDIFWL